MAGFIASLAAPFAMGLVQNVLGGITGAGGAGGAAGNPLSLLTDPFKALLGQVAKSPLMSILAPLMPSLFSTAGIAPQVLNNPTQYLEPAMDRMGEAAEVMSQSYGSARVRDHRGDGSGDAVVRDHRGSNGGVVVRDHRPGRPYTVPPPPPRSRPTGGYTDKYSAIEALQQEKEAAQNASLSDPENAAKQLKAQDAAHAFQLMFSQLLEDKNKESELASRAIQSFNLRA